jgi:hypothetical protein
LQMISRFCEILLPYPQGIAGVRELRALRFH